MGINTGSPTLTNGKSANLAAKYKGDPAETENMVIFDGTTSEEHQGFLAKDWEKKGWGKEQRKTKINSGFNLTAACLAAWCKIQCNTEGTLSQRWSINVSKRKIMLFTSSLKTPFLNKRTYFRMHVLLILVVVSSVLSSSNPEPDPDAALLHSNYPSAPIDYCANGGICLPPVLCSLHYLETLYDPSSACSVAEGTPGLCCPPITKRPCKYLVPFQLS